MTDTGLCGYLASNSSNELHGYETSCNRTFRNLGRAVGAG
jgi:hypothetical protein